MDKKKKSALSETDIAYQILREHKAPLHYRELITAVLEQMGEGSAISGSRLAQIHTEINLDSRFDFLGKGMWGLQAWAPKTASRVSTGEPNESSYQPKAIDYLWDEEEEDLDDDDEEAGFISSDEIDEDDTEEEEAELVIDDFEDDEVEDLDEVDEEEDPELA